jgi:hypothetical protein
VPEEFTASLGFEEHGQVAKNENKSILLPGFV